MANKAPSMLLPALTTGIVAGFLSGLPRVSLACCLWAASAGFLAALWYSRKSKQTGAYFGPGSGAVLGMLVGSISGLLGGGISARKVFVDIKENPDVFREAAESAPTFGDPQGAEQAMQILESTGPLLFATIILFLWLVTGVVFAVIGGLIGGAVFKIEAPATISGDGWSASPPSTPPADNAPPPPPVAPGSPPREE